MLSYASLLASLDVMLCLHLANHCHYFDSYPLPRGALALSSIEMHSRKSNGTGPKLRPLFPLQPTHLYGYTSISLLPSAIVLLHCFNYHRITHLSIVCLRIIHPQATPHRTIHL